MAYGVFVSLHHNHAWMMFLSVTVTRECLGFDYEAEWSWNRTH